MLKRKFTIVIAGNDESAYDDALAQATQQIQDGYLAGHNADGAGGYHFDSTEDVPDGEIPAGIDEVAEDATTGDAAR